MEATSMTEPLTPSRRALLAQASPYYFEIEDMPTPASTLSAAIEPDDWRLFYLMRELTEDERARVLEYAELLFNLAHARRWAEGEE
jgi:hypothetical protein